MIFPHSSGYALRDTLSALLLALSFLSPMAQNLFSPISQQLTKLAFEAQSPTTFPKAPPRQMAALMRLEDASDMSSYPSHREMEDTAGELHTVQNFGNVGHQNGASSSIVVYTTTTTTTTAMTRMSSSLPSTAAPPHDVGWTVYRCLRAILRTPVMSCNTPRPARQDGR